MSDNLRSSCVRCGWCCIACSVHIPKLTHPGQFEYKPLKKVCPFLYWEDTLAACKIYGQEIAVTSKTGSIYTIPWNQGTCGQFCSQGCSIGTYLQTYLEQEPPDRIVQRRINIAELDILPYLWVLFRQDREFGASHRGKT